jgi:hypothetical protein
MTGGGLERMAPSPIHEISKILFRIFFLALAEEWDFPFHGPTLFACVRDNAFIRGKS